MAFERQWPVVPPQSFIADGTQFGLVTVADSCKFRVKQSAYLINTAGTTLAVQIKKVINPTQLFVGIISSNMSTWKPLDISSWTVASGAKIGAQEQNRNNIPPEDHYVAIYEAEPVVADRVIQVDCNGDFYGPDNPFPIIFDGNLQVGNVRITACDDDPLPGDKHSSIRISDCVNDLAINSDGSINVVVTDGPVVGHEVISTYDEVLSVASGVQTTIVSYTVPVSKTAVLQRVNTSGQNVGRYDVFLNGAPFDTQLTYFGGDFNALFEYTTGTADGYVLNAGDVVNITILHNRPFVGNFTARIQVLEIS